ncbi:hypothetical protein HMPREF1575_00147 [Gardnerella vaginalis JCP7672]|nr:hypothetical protein HMPREF1575_00147 [Gardnerella vaginalis JCP7672]
MRPFCACHKNGRIFAYSLCGKTKALLRQYALLFQRFCREFLPLWIGFLIQLNELCIFVTEER